MSLQSLLASLPRKQFALALGPLLFLLVLSLPLEDMNEAAQGLLACTLWIAAWWIGEPVPIPVTSLLPILLFPLTGALDLNTTTSAYGNPVIFLFLGGFMLALAMEKWNLHKRIALKVILFTGTDSRKIILGFMLATGILSMWISNTATAMMMLPIGIAIVAQFTDFTPEQGLGMNNKFGTALMLGIGYAASIGGMGTLIGTPANAIFAAVAESIYDVEISFFQWMLVGFPVAIILLLICWYYMVTIAFPLERKDSSAGKEEIQKQLRELGKISYEEKAVGVVFLLTALAWVTRSFLLTPLFPALDDSMIAMAGVALLFIIPSRSKGFTEGLITWNVAKRLPWGILLLFGGGLAIASGFEETGLTTYIGSQLTLLQGASLFIILLAIATFVNFSTEITSNTATATMLLPIMASLSAAVGIHPFGPMVAACLASSCAFMLPVATPPNAIVFGTGYIKMQQMIKAGFWMNVMSIILLTLFLYLLLPLAWGLDIFSFPESFK